MRAKIGVALTLLGVALTLLGVALAWVACRGSEPPGDEMLVAWAAPLWGSVEEADHTWITTYRSPTACAPPTEDYWYCTGACRDTTDPSIVVRELGHWPADLRLAHCIAQPNSYAILPGRATSGIIYGIDGVCHQIANRILYAASDGDTPPTVQAARPYWATWALYGTYGDVRRPWQWRLVRYRCAAGDRETASEEEGFAAWLEERLGERAEQVEERFDKLRKEMRTETRALDLQVVSGEISGREFANRINQLASNRFRATLGDKDYERLFEIPADENLLICDPAIAGEIDYQSVRLEQER